MTFPVNQNDLPLNDLLVVDLSRLVSGNILTHVLADLGALEEMAAVETGAQDEVAGQQGLGITENLEDFFLGRAHAAFG